MTFFDLNSNAEDGRILVALEQTTRRLDSVCSYLTVPSTICSMERYWNFIEKMDAACTIKRFVFHRDTPVEWMVWWRELISRSREYEMKIVSAPRCRIQTFSLCSKDNASLWNGAARSMVAHLPIENRLLSCTETRHFATGKERSLARALRSMEDGMWRERISRSREYRRFITSLHRNQTFCFTQQVASSLPRQWATRGCLVLCR